MLESVHYDLYGKPTETSVYGVVDLYAGERWISTLGLYDLRNRFMSPELGRFLQADPIGFKGDASNLYRYCHNDPENFTDPDGMYARGDGWKGEEWKKFNDAQKSGATALERAAAITEKGTDAAKKAFENAFGKGTATKENMSKLSQNMKAMAAALRDTREKIAYRLTNPILVPSICLLTRLATRCVPERESRSTSSTKCSTTPRS